MNADDALDAYIRSHIDPEPDNLYRLWRHVNTSLLYPRMCSGHLQGRLLTMLTALVNPRRVLELGTYAGYSALCLAEGLQRDDARVDTVEIDDEMEQLITDQLAASPYGNRVNLIIGDALTLLPALPVEDYDLVYIDANKRSYLDYYNLIIDRLHPGACILADNTLWDGKVLDTAANHDDQTAALARFNDFVAADTRVSRVILPLRDGLTIIRKL